MIDHSIDEKLQKLIERVEKISFNYSSQSHRDESILDELMKFGLSNAQAKVWLKKEPNYSKRKVTDNDENDGANGEVPEPEKPT